MNNDCPTERIVRLIAFGLCALVYTGVFVLVLRGLENRPPHSVSVKAVTLSIAQIELQAEPSPPPEPKPLLEPKVIQEEEADVALDEVIEKPEPISQPQSVPMPDSEAPVAQVTQEASAEQYAVSPDTVMEWALMQIETEKYYPAAAERFGLTGSFDLYIAIDASGTIRSAQIISEGGHRVLRQAVQKVLSTIIGLRYFEPIGETLEFEVEFTFE